MRGRGGGEEGWGGRVGREHINNAMYAGVLPSTHLPFASVSFTLTIYIVLHVVPELNGQFLYNLHVPLRSPLVGNIFWERAIL